MEKQIGRKGLIRTGPWLTPLGCHCQNQRFHHHPVVSVTITEVLVRLVNERYRFGEVITRKRVCRCNYLLGPIPPHSDSQLREKSKSLLGGANASLFGGQS